VLIGKGLDEAAELEGFCVFVCVGGRERGREGGLGKRVVLVWK